MINGKKYRACFSLNFMFAPSSDNDITKSIIFKSGFDTSNLTWMNGMFQGCISLTSLDLSSFNTQNVTDMSYMFWDCPNLKTIYVTENQWVIPSKKTYMFYNCGTSSVTYKDFKE